MTVYSVYDHPHQVYRHDATTVSIVGTMPDNGHVASCFPTEGILGIILKCFLV